MNIIVITMLLVGLSAHAMEEGIDTHKKQKTEHPSVALSKPTEYQPETLAEYAFRKLVGRTTHSDWSTETTIDVMQKKHNNNHQGLSDELKKMFGILLICHPHPEKIAQAIFMYDNNGKPRYAEVVHHAFLKACNNEEQLQFLCETNKAVNTVIRHTHALRANNYQYFMNELVKLDLSTVKEEAQADLLYAYIKMFEQYEDQVTDEDSAIHMTDKEWKDHINESLRQAIEMPGITVTRRRLDLVCNAVDALADLQVETVATQNKAVTVDEKKQKCGIPFTHITNPAKGDLYTQTLLATARELLYFAQTSQSYSMFFADLLNTNFTPLQEQTQAMFLRHAVALYNNYKRTQFTDEYDSMADTEPHNTIKKAAEVALKQPYNTIKDASALMYAVDLFGMYKSMEFEEEEEE